MLSFEGNRVATINGTCVESTGKTFTDTFGVVWRQIGLVGEQGERWVCETCERKELSSCCIVVRPGGKFDTAQAHHRGVNRELHPREKHVEGVLHEEGAPTTDSDGCSWQLFKEVDEHGNVLGWRSRCLLCWDRRPQDQVKGYCEVMDKTSSVLPDLCKLRGKMDNHKNNGGSKPIHQAHQVERSQVQATPSSRYWSSGSMIPPQTVSAPPAMALPSFTPVPSLQERLRRVYEDSVGPYEQRPLLIILAELEGRMNLPGQGTPMQRTVQLELAIQPPTAQCTSSQMPFQPPALYVASNATMITTASTVPQSAPVAAPRAPPVGPLAVPRAPSVGPVAAPRALVAAPRAPPVGPLAVPRAPPVGPLTTPRAPPVGPLTAPRAPPVGPLTAPKALVDEPNVPLDVPDAPLAAPRTPLAAPKVPLAAPKALVDAPNVPLDVPDAPLDVPDAPFAVPRAPPVGPLAGAAAPLGAMHDTAAATLMCANVLVQLGDGVSLDGNWSIHEGNKKFGDIRVDGMTVVLTDLHRSCSTFEFCNGILQDEHDKLNGFGWTMKRRDNRVIEWYETCLNGTTPVSTQEQPTYFWVRAGSSSKKKMRLQ